uniref:IMS import disulfide relay-system CHCH-CHCH-like Cx9C domain-containing protein n=2 Tax=Oryzias latipes TaxID=8090 RepID=A0A3P9JY40_ORYLA
MQAAMDISAKYCQKELESYGSCVSSNPSTWQQKCHELKMKVAHCTASHPVIQKIKRDCSKEFVEFDKCLRENQSTPTSCTSHVARFVGCAETVDLSKVGEFFLEHRGVSRRVLLGGGGQRWPQSYCEGTLVNLKLPGCAMQMLNV